MTTPNKIARRKLSLLELAAELGSARWAIHPQRGVHQWVILVRNQHLRDVAFGGEPQADRAVAERFVQVGDR